MRKKTWLLYFILPFLMIPLPSFAEESALKEKNKNLFFSKAHLSIDRKVQHSKFTFINDSGTVVWCDNMDIDLSHAFFHDGNKVFPIGNTLSSCVRIADLNDKGTVIFTASHGQWPNFDTSGYLLKNGENIKLFRNDTENCFPISINEHDDVAGYCAAKASPLDVTLYLWSKGKRTALTNVPIESGSNSIDFFINDKRQITIEFDHNSYFWDKNQVTKLEPSTPAMNVWISDLNNKGQVVGFICDETKYPSTPFLWEKGRFTEFEAMGSYPSCLFSDINNRGQIVGQALTMTPNLDYKGLLYDNGRYTDLSAGLIRITSQRINEKGTILGFQNTFESQFNAKLVLWKNENYKVLGKMPGSLGCIAEGFNNKNQITGLCLNQNFSLDFFIWQNGVFTSLTQLATKQLPSSF